MTPEAVSKMHKEHAMPSFKEQYNSLRDGKVKGFECVKCHKRSVTPLARCDCGGDVVQKTFASTGKVETYTIQRIASEQFINDTPFAWVVVQLDDGGPRVTGWIPYIGKPGEIKIGDKVRLTTSYKPGFMFEKA